MKIKNTPIRLPRLLLDGTIEIQLTQGQTTIVDNVDADLAELNWHTIFNANSKDGYNFRAVHSEHDKSGKTVTVLLHRVILSRILNRELLKPEKVDHKDLNPLNNKRDNLRLATAMQNAYNTSKLSTNTSGFKGVHFRKDTSKWSAGISINGRFKYLGSFQTPEEAYAVYCEAAKTHYGEFARLE